mmetsp:Transcript_23556/g.52165  ORF Transcript_23556/g.52165 Transcript_23556/m.52165 type:complete len:263 (+) Transcript_23556:51-839(+)
MPEALEDPFVRGRDLLGRSAGCAALITVVHLSLHALVCRLPIEPRSRGDWANRVVASLHALIVAVACMPVLFLEAPFAGQTAAVLRWEQVVDTVHGESEALWSVLPLSLGYFIYDCFYMAIDPEAFSQLMVVHHVLSLIVWPTSVLSRRGVYYVAVCLCTEISTPLLHLVVFFMPKHGLSDSPAYIPLGLTLLLLFFCCRVLPIPFLIRAMWASWEFWQPADRGIFTLWLLSVPLPPFLNTYWFFRLVRGAIKPLRAKARSQ